MTTEDTALARRTLRQRLAARVAAPELAHLNSELRAERGKRETAERRYDDHIAREVISSSVESQADRLARRIESEWFRQGVPRDELGRPLAVPVRAVRRGGDIRLRARAGLNGKPPAYLSEALIWDTPEARQGWPGLDFTGGVPNAESRKDSKPYKLRGLGINHGSAFNVYRGDPAVRDSVDTRVNFLLAGTAEFGVPDAVLALPPETRDRLGIDLDAIQRHADELNVELAVNPNIRERTYLSEMYRVGHIAGFSAHEFSIDPTLDEGRRIVFIESRHPSSLQFWVLDHLGHVVGFSQVAPSERGDGSSVPVVDMRRVLHFAHNSDAGNPEGQSMIRPAWFWHTFGTEFAQSALLHRQRFGPGVPIFERLPNTDGGGEEMSETINEAAKNFYYAADAYMSVPRGVIVKMLQVQAETGLEPILRFVNEQKRTALGADVLALGNNGVGAYNLGDVKSQMLLRSLEGFAAGPEEAHDALAKAYVDAVHGPQMVYPRLKIRGILDRSSSEAITVAERIADLETGSDAPLAERNDLRRRVGMPTIAEDDPRAEKAEDVRELSGVLVQSIAAVVEKVAAGTLPQSAATDLIVVAGIDRDTAERMAASAAGLTPPAGEPAPPETRHVHMRAVALIPVQTVGGPLLLRREPTPLEASVNLRAVSDTMERASDRAFKALTDVAKVHRQRWIKAARPLIASGDLVGLSRLSVDMTDEYEAALLMVLEDASETSSNEMLNEIRRQTGIRRPEAVEQEGSGPGLQTIIAAAASAAAVKVNDLFNQRLRDVGGQVAQGADRSLLTEAEPAPIYTRPAANASALAVIASTREHVATTSGPRIVAAVRTEVLDGNTCDPCADIDEMRVPFPSAAYDAIKPPYARCESTKGGENMCRGLTIFIFEETRAELVGEG